MHAYQELPRGYAPFLKIDLQEDKRLALWINGAAAVVTVILLVVGHFLMVPVWEMVDLDPNVTMLRAMLRPIVMLLGTLAYIVLHELTHAAAMKCFGAKKLRFGFTGLYAYAGSEGDYFDRHAYIPIALAPLAVWGVIFTVMLILVPRTWFWVVYFWQIFNITGAAGDIYVSWRTARLAEDVLVKDTGVSMTFYKREV
ncbi:MAG: DUF3267 domain-containing protein [Oscillospiraceae bacterium]|nr:DUF3267 domain-containing protein [Oscillospiraceae bacterium]